MFPHGLCVLQLPFSFLCLAWLQPGVLLLAFWVARAASCLCLKNSTKLARRNVCLLSAPHVKVLLVLSSELLMEVYSLFKELKKKCINTIMAR